MPRQDFIAWACRVADHQRAMADQWGQEGDALPGNQGPALLEALRSSLKEGV